MDEAVAHRDNKPVFYRRDLLFTHLVVDVVQYEVFGTTSEYIVYFAATSKYQCCHQGFFKKNILNSLKNYRISGITTLNSSKNYSISGKKYPKFFENCSISGEKIP